jgi:hypothetical protein
MKPNMTNILGFDVLGPKTLALMSGVWAPNKATTYESTICRYFDSYDEHMLASLAATPAHMARYVSWLGELGTI